MKKYLLAFFVMGSIPNYGEVLDASAVRSNMVNRLSKRESTFSEDYTNILIRYANSTSGLERTTASIALGIAMFDRFDATGERSALDSCIQICSNVVNASSTVSNSWQRAMASIVYASTFSLDGKYNQAYSICTNAMNVMPLEPRNENDQRLWNAMCRHQSSCSMSVADTLRFYSALSLLIGNTNSPCAVYTNALPQDAMSKIRQVLE